MRFQSSRTRFLLRAGGLAALLMVAPAVLADTIYLKNGRVIHTERAVKVGDKVEFMQFGQKMSISASLVDRIEKDQREEEAPLPTAEDDREKQESEGESGESEGGEEAEENPEETREYWRGRVEAIETEKEEIATRIEELRREERAFLFSHRSTKETREKIEAAQTRDKELDQEMVDLRREARRKGIPPGWLRA